MRSITIGFLALAAAVAFASAPGERPPAQAAERPQLSFVDSTRSSGVAHKPTLTWGSTWVDHDADADIDLLANRHWKAPRLYLQRAAGYVLARQTFHSGRQRFFDRHTCAWGEANGDAHVDLYCDSGAQKGKGRGSNQLWIWTDAGYVNRSRAYHVRDPFARSRTVNWLDYDSDGDLDIFTASKFRAGYPNSLFRNDRGVFTKVDVGLTREMNALVSTWSDWDNDGDPDLIVLRYHPAHALAYENLGGRFRARALDGITDAYWSSAVWGDYDGDGWTDLQLVNHRRTIVMRNTNGTLTPAHRTKLARGASSAWIDVDQDGDLDSYIVQARESGTNQPDFFLVNREGRFTEVRDASIAGRQRGSGEAVAVADYNGDGALDLFVTNGATIFEESLLEGRWSLLRNTTQIGNWMTLVIEGGPWNPWGFGSRISVSAGNLRYQRQLNDGMAFRTQSQIGRVALGLGNETAASVKVQWPDGTTDCATVVAGRTIRIVKGTGGC